MSFGKLSMLCHHHSLILHLHCTKKKPAHLQSFSLPTLGQAKQPLIFLLPWICLFWTKLIRNHTMAFKSNCFHLRWMFLRSHPCCSIQQYWRQQYSYEWIYYIYCCCYFYSVNRHLEFFVWPCFYFSWVGTCYYCC